MGFSQHKITTNYTQTLADYIYNTQYEDIPAEVIERAKVITTQVIGVSLAAKNMADTQKAIALTRLLNGGTQGEATGWVSGDPLSPANAAFQAGARTIALASRSARERSRQGQRPRSRSSPGWGAEAASRWARLHQQG